TPHTVLSTLSLHDALPIFLDIGERDIPMLTKAYREGFTEFQLVDAKGIAYNAPTNRDDLLQYIAKVKNETAIADLTENATKVTRSEEHTSELQSRENLVCR